MSTKPDSISKIESARSRFELKGRLLSSLRGFFASESFLEVNTPVRIKAPAPEEFIEAISSEDHFLRTSPELEMKRMLAAGFEKIYQIGPCFRSGEFGRNHRTEFLMLEYYQAHADYMQLLELTRKMITHAARELLPGMKASFRENTIDFNASWEIISVRDAFERYAETSAEEALKNDLFDLLLVEKVEPALPKNVPVVMKDYPAQLASLSRLKAEDNTLGERWELYIGGLEIANAFGELTNPEEQKERFKKSYEFRKSAGMKDYPEPPEFYEALDAGIPESSGCALGFDRLAMVFSNADDIAQITLS